MSGDSDPEPAETYDRALCARLMAEASEDDERMTRAPWCGDGQSGILFGDGDHEDGSVELASMAGEALSDDVEGIARTRNNLRPLAEQLEAAMSEIERLRARIQKDPR